ncbi:MAG: hypothetical protein RR678_11445 [Lachnospiraceae bacterium]
MIRIMTISILAFMFTAGTIQTLILKKSDDVKLITIFFILDFVFLELLYKELNPKYYVKFKAVNKYMKYKTFIEEIKSEKFIEINLAEKDSVRIKKSRNWVYIQEPYFPRMRGTFIPINFIYGIRVSRKGVSQYIDLYMLTYGGMEFYFGRCVGAERNNIESRITTFFPNIEQGMIFSNRIEENLGILKDVRNQFDEQMHSEQDFVNYIHTKLDTIDY